MPKANLPVRRGLPGARAFFCLLLAAVMGGGAYAGEPYTPAGDAKVLQRLPAASAMQRLAPLRNALQRDPGNLDVALQLAQRYLELARTQADPRLLGYAQAALEPWPSESAPAEVLILRATVLQSRHDFEQALELLELALQREPNNAQAVLTRANILLAQGQPDAATQSCQRLQNKVSPLIFTVCLSSAAARSGALAAAHEQLVQSLSTSPQAPPAIKSWALTELGEQAERLGNLAAADRYFAAGLQLNPNDVYLLGAYADLLLAQQRNSEVIDLLQNHEDAQPLLLRLALADPDNSKGKKWPAKMQDFLHASEQRQDGVHLREQAIFYLHVTPQPERALALARQNWDIQKEPADLLLLLRAAAAANSTNAAEPGQEWINRYGYEDARLAPLRAKLQASP